MKKVLSYICIIIGLALLTTATSRPLLGYIWERKHHNKWWGEHQGNYGDLTNIAYLDEIKKFQSPKDYVFVKPDDTGIKNIDLYLYGDSYTEEVPGYAFARVAYYHYGRNRYTDLTYKLDKTKRNVLIIETAERYVRSDFSSFDIYNHVKRSAPASSGLLHFRDVNNGKVLAGIDLNVSSLFNPNINQNLEYLLFNVNAMNKPRFLKANLNYYCFNRGSGNAVISDDGNHLFLKETVAPNSIYSSYEPFTDDMAIDYTRRILEIYDHYKKEGFDEVYLTIIPNPASLLQPKGYNNLIPTLQDGDRMHMPIIDLYSRYMLQSNPAQYYRSGDTHWNNKGLQLWLEMVNEKLQKQPMQ